MLWGPACVRCVAWIVERAAAARMRFQHAAVRQVNLVGGDIVHRSPLVVAAVDVFDEAGAGVSKMPLRSSIDRGSGKRA
jgi:hypothetical protein